VNGRIVSFEIQNLNGIDGKTGNIKIQLAPAWAPRGVARFEVRLCTKIKQKQFAPLDLRCAQR
jgi:hypothetical protein